MIVEWKCRIDLPDPPEGWQWDHRATERFDAVDAFAPRGIVVYNGRCDQDVTVQSLGSPTKNLPEWDGARDRLSTPEGLIAALSDGFREFGIAWPTREEDTVEPDPIDQPDGDLHLLRLFTDGGPQFDLECIGHDYRLCAAHRAFGDGESVTLNDNPSFPIPVVFVADDDDLSPDEGQEVGVWGDLGPWVWEDWRTSSAARIAKIKGGAS